MGARCCSPAWFPILSDSCDPVDCSPPGSSVHGFSGVNSGVGSRFLLQKVFPTRGQSPNLLCPLHWQADSLPRVTPGKPYEEVGAAFFPVTKYSVNEQINELNNKFYMSLITYEEFFYFHVFYFQKILTTFSHDYFFCCCSFISFSLGPNSVCICSSNRFEDLSLKISVT